MDLEWDYYYYQPQSNNKWLIQELMGDNDMIEGDDKITDKRYL